MLTMPSSTPSLSTGRWRMRRSVIRAINPTMLSSGAQVTTSWVISSLTRISSAAAAKSTRACTMSRSDRIPNTRAPSSLITTAPIRFSFSNRAASATLAFCGMVTMSRPFAFRISSTIMGLRLRSPTDARRHPSARRRGRTARRY